MLEVKKRKTDYLDLMLQIPKWLYAPIHEILTGIRLNTLPYQPCIMIGLFCYVVILTGLDKVIFNWFKINSLYPEGLWGYHAYTNFWLFSGFILWGIMQVGLRKKLIRRLTEVFIASGLKSGLGKLPDFIADRAIDDDARKLTLLKNHIPFDKFVSAKKSMQDSLQVFIDSIQDNREKGTLDIFYSHTPLPSLIKSTGLDSLSPNTYVVGNTRSKKITAHLKKVPHLMVVGQTNQGKSTFLRQAIVGLYLNNPRMTFTLVDLKEGLEFQSFEDVKRITTCDTLEGAVISLKKVQSDLIERMRIIKQAKCKDIDELNLKSHSDLKALGLDPTKSQFDRHMVIIDEVAEIFLVKKSATTGRVQEAKRIIDKIARQGRACGLHLMLATQRPDVKSLDARVKSNLAGTVCFPMSNVASSVTAINTRRAFDLPNIKGRAIWKCGYDCFEIQTGYLEPKECDKIIEPHKVPKEQIVKDKPEEQDNYKNVITEVIANEN